MIKVPPPATPLTEVSVRPAAIGKPAVDFRNALSAEPRQAAATALPVVECTITDRRGVRETVTLASCTEEATMRTWPPEALPARPEPTESQPPLSSAGVQPTIGDARLSAAAWRLTPSGTLAQATVHHTLATERTPVRQLTGGTADTRAGRAVIAKPATVPGNRPLAERTAVTGLADGRAVRHVASKHDSGAMPPAVADWAAALPVAERLFRWMQREGEGATGWVRDYRLDDDAAARLMERIRAYVQEYDLSLERIVINGHELWRKS